jgi:hypothetical protein
VSGVGTTETVPSSVASTDPPTLGIFQAPVTETTPIVATTSTVCTCSIDLDCFTATSIYRGSAWQFRFWGGYFTVCDHSTLLGTWPDCFCSPVGSLVLFFLAFDAKGGERVDLGGVLLEGFILFVCYIHASCLISRPAFCDKCACETLLYIMSLNWF